ncbi:MAG: DUF748 domain-containing protein [Eudoraea sp.]|nr:DUF748 domain-containing protein [Eudoraea sp.]
MVINKIGDEHHKEVQKWLSLYMGKKILKIVGWVVAGILTLVIISLLYLKIAGPAYVKKQMIERVEDRTNGRYSLAIDSLDFRFFPISLHLGGVKLKRNYEIRQYSGNPLLDKFNIDLRFRSLYVDRFKVRRFLFGNHLKVDEFRWIEPSLVVRKNRNYDPSRATQEQIDTVSVVARDSIQADTLLADGEARTEFVETSRQVLPSLDLKRLEIQNAYFAIYGGIVEEPVQEVKGLRLNLNEVKFKEDDDIPFGVEGLSIELDSAFTIVSNSTAKLGVAGLDITPQNYHLDSVYYHNTVNRYRMNRLKGFRANWVDLRVKNLDLNGLDYAQMIADSAVLVNKIEIQEVYVNLFKDKSEKRINLAHQALPPELVRNIPVPVDVDTLLIRNATLHLDAQAPSAKAPGRLILDPINVQITNLTNLPSRLTEDPMMVLQLDTRLMGVAPLNARYQFKIDDPADTFTVSGSLAPMDAKVMNPFIGSQFFIEFKSGYFDTVEFTFTGNNQANVGEMDLEYRKLAFRKLQNYQQFLDKSPKMGFVSAAGTFVVPSNRSKSDKHYKKSVIYYEKEYNRDFIHGTVMSVLSGFANSLGVLRKDLGKMQEQAKNVEKKPSKKLFKKKKKN